MFKHRLTISDYLLIVVNCIPLFGVWFEGWDANPIFIVYCMETVIIGIINVIKMACITLLVRKKDVWENGNSTSMQSGWFFILFFILHYGFFVFVQTQIFFGVAGLKQTGDLIMNYASIPALLGNEGKLMLLLFIAYYTAQSFFEFFNDGAYKKISLGRQMFEPYLRIFVQQFVVIAGSFFLAFGAGKIFILIFVLVKIFFELFVNFSRLLTLAEKKQRLKEEREHKI